MRHPPDRGGRDDLRTSQGLQTATGTQHSTGGSHPSSSEDTAQATPTSPVDGTKGRHPLIRWAIEAGIIPPFEDDEETTPSPLSIPDVAGLDIPHAADAYAAAGLTIFPINPATRRPLWRGWPELAAADATWWETHPRHGIGLHPGADGLVAVDVDEPELLPAALAAELAHAPYQASRPDQPGRGHYLLDAGGRIRNRNKAEMGWGDVKGWGGYVALTPTPHSKGGEYGWVRIGPVLALADAPAVREEITAAARQRDHSSGAAAPRAIHPPPAGEATRGWQWPRVPGLAPGYAAALANECGRAASASKGTRNTVLASATWSIGRYVEIPRDIARAELIAAGLASGQDLDEVERTVEHQLEQGAKSPRYLRLRLPNRTRR